MSSGSVRVSGAATISALRKLRIGLGRAAEQALDAAILATTASAKATTLWKDVSGRTRASIDGRRNGMRGFVKAGEAARFLEHGTRPASIARTVRFADGSFRRFIHPGIAERPFMAQAREVGEKTARYGGEFYTSQAIRKFNA